jgi:PAS domain S-box-containing protein
MMAKRSFSLGFKGLCLGLLLLALELFFVGANAWLLHNAEQESSRQRTTKEVIARASDLMQSLYNAGDSMAKYSFGHDMAALTKYEATRAEISSQLGWIRRNVSDNPEQRESFSRIETNINSSLGLLADMKKISETEAPMVAMQYAAKLQAKMQARTQALVKDMLAFLDSEKKIESDSPAAMRLQRERMKWLLVAGLLANIITSLVVSSLFVRGITSRLSVVLDNSMRLKAGEKLNAPMSGDDEIASLDEAFHTMSQSLRGEEQLIRAGEQQLRAIIDQMPIGLVIIDETERIEYANPALEKMLAYDGGSLTKRRMAEQFALPGKEKPFKIADIAADTIQLTALKKDGSELAVEFSLSPTPLTGFVRRLAVVIDISEKLAMEKMRQAFVSMVSHDLRTPLTSVAGFLQLLPMGVYGKLEPTTLKETALADYQVNNLITLINDLLDLEKMQANKHEPVKVIVRVEDAIDAAISAQYEQCEAKGLSVLFEGCENKVSFNADALLRVFSKFLETMVQLAPGDGNIDITVAGQPGNKTQASAPVRVTFSVRELNLPTEQLQTIFEPFQQVGQGDSQSTLCLALPLARAIVEQHGGKCGAENMGQSGTALWMQL